MGSRWRAAVVGAVLGASCLSACGDGGSDRPTKTESPGASSGSWPESVDPVDTSGLVYAAGTTVHLADDTKIDVGEEIETFVVAGDGVFFTAVNDQTGPSYGGDILSRTLYYSDGDAPPSQVADAAATLRTSPDGRYLAFLDLASGEPDEFGTPQAAAVVVDLQAGDELVRSSEGMGDPGSDDLAALYPEASIGVFGFTDEVAYIDGVGDLYGYDLATGEGEVVSDKTEDDFDLPPFDDRRSPDGAWKIVDDDRYDQLQSRSGTRVEPVSSVPLLNLVWWADARTAVGTAIDGHLRQGQLQPGASASLVVCTVPSGRCEAVDGTDGEVVHVPEGTADNTEFTLPDGS